MRHAAVCTVLAPRPGELPEESYRCLKEVNGFSQESKNSREEKKSPILCSQCESTLHAHSKVTLHSALASTAVLHKSHAETKSTELSQRPVTA